MSSSLFNPVLSMDDLIQSGRHCCAIQKYERALPFFTRAIGSCPCTRGLQRRRCTCKNFKRGAGQGGSISKEVMHPCYCDVGILFKKCDNPYHILALDLRAASHEAMGRLDDAMNDAEWMVELAPRLPDGYLRLGKVARLQNNYEYAWGMYTTGIEINEEFVMGLSPRLLVRCMILGLR
ncbi:uncharacterized protein CPUR_03472 [Claviceps purpurea 20.1]|uniref:Uncharacterized protein n=1 Tax=Claviceps purpurea (strain 20.1) TaxID=1111077 RepID=M1W519_CLAP2|nr:uncharacterized protein CPUR_03472 [Claviceps purpurea 20.1]